MEKRERYPSFSYDLSKKITKNNIKRHTVFLKKLPKLTILLNSLPSFPVFFTYLLICSFLIINIV